MSLPEPLEINNLSPWLKCSSESCPSGVMECAMLSQFCLIQEGEWLCKVMSSLYRWGSNINEGALENKEACAKLSLQNKRLYCQCWIKACYVLNGFILSGHFQCLFFFFPCIQLYLLWNIMRSYITFILYLCFSSGSKPWHWIGIGSPVLHQFLGCFGTGEQTRQLDRVQDCREGRGERRNVTAWKPACPDKNCRKPGHLLLLLLSGGGHSVLSWWLLQDRWLWICTKETREQRH